LATVAVAALLAACGGESSSDSNETAGKYPVKVTEASFPTEQHLGQTSLLKLAIRNTGRKTIPALTVTITIAGKRGSQSSLPFGIHDPQAGLAQGDRPVWVLSETYPRRGTSSDPGGASSSNRKTFDFGPVKAGETSAAVWKLSAVKAGKFTLLYRIDAGLSGSARAVTGKNELAPGGSFATTIESALPETEVTDDGQIVEIEKGKAG
jgi:hypothetical protein